MTSGASIEEQWGVWASERVERIQHLFQRIRDACPVVEHSGLHPLDRPGLRIELTEEGGIALRLTIKRDDDLLIECSRFGVAITQSLYKYGASWLILHVRGDLTQPWSQQMVDLRERWPRNLFKGVDIALRMAMHAIEHGMPMHLQTEWKRALVGHLRKTDSLDPSVDVWMHWSKRWVTSEMTNALVVTTALIDPTENFPLWKSTLLECWTAQLECESLFNVPDPTW